MIPFLYILISLGCIGIFNNPPTDIPSPSDRETIHPFHFSKCKIKYHPEDSTLQVTLILFLDDLESALHNVTGTPLYICDEMESDDTDSLIGQYLNDRLQFDAGPISLQRTFLGKECAKDNLSIWCYTELKIQGIPTVLSLENRIFTELYGDQKNLVIVAFSKDQIEEKILSSSRVSATFEY